MNKNDRRPLIDPFLMLMRSRRVIVALSALLVSIAVMFVPAIDAVRGEITVIVITLALALISGYTIEDAVVAARDATPPESQREQIRELVDAILEEGVSSSAAPYVIKRKRNPPVPPIR